MRTLAGARRSRLIVAVRSPGSYVAPESQNYRPTSLCLPFAGRPVTTSQATDTSGSTRARGTGGRAPQWSHRACARGTVAVVAAAGRQASRTPPPASPGVSSWRRPGAGLARLSCATRWRRVHDGRATRWRRVAQHFLTTAHMPIFVPRGGVECTICVPLGGSEWHAHETARLRGHRRRKWRRVVARTPWTSHAPQFSMRSPSMRVTSSSVRSPTADDGCDR